MNKQEAASHLGISVRTLLRHMKVGNIGYAKVRGKTGEVVDFMLAELERFRREHLAPTVTPTFTPDAPVSQPRKSSQLGAPSGSNALARRPEFEAFAQMVALTRQGPPPVQLSLGDKLTLSLADAALLAGLSKDYLTKAIHAGKLKAAKRGRGWNIKRADLEAWVKRL